MSASNLPEAGHARKCSHCGAALSGDLLEGQCPVCIVRILETAPDMQIGFASKINGAGSCAQNHDDGSGNSLGYFGEYELLAEIGRGGMGLVYQARHMSLNRVVALKLIAPEQLNSPKAIERFHTETEAAAALDHPNIVPLYESGQCEGRHYFSMKFVQGTNLAELLAQNTLPSQTAGGRATGLDPSQNRLPVIGSNSRDSCRLLLSAYVRLAAKVARAVHYAHQHGLLHRDLKPGNILLNGEQEPHVADFGLAKRFESDSTLTVSGEVLGTPTYMAPEQAAGSAKSITTAADIYSLGAILYHLLTGRPPFAGKSSIETLHAVLHEEPRSPRSVNGGVPRDLETICLKCLEKEPAKRYASAEELAEELERFLRGEPIAARPVSVPEKLWRWCRRKPALAATVLLLLLTFGLGLAGVLVEWQQARANAAASHSNELAAREGLYCGRHQPGPAGA